MLTPSVDFARLHALLADRCGDAADCPALLEQRPHLFAAGAIRLPGGADTLMRRLIATVEQAVALPAYQETVLARAPRIAQFEPGPRGVFFGYDFHLADTTPKLIEINTNAGGGLLNVLLAASLSEGGTDAAALEEAFLAMFREEWRRQRGDQPLRSIAIVDDDPSGQYLYPEFLLFQALFRRAGYTALIAAPSDLGLRDGALYCGATRVDLVYNRLTDFMLEEPAHAALREAYLAGAAVLTPHPRAHALYADKRNLALLCDPATLCRLGAPPTLAECLARCIPTTVEVTPDSADHLWHERRHLFFKPIHGYGSKGAYRGEKLTRRVWQEILAGQYVAQAFVPPSRRVLQEAAELKMDFRYYVYGGQPQLVAARLYQGQTTNFRTPQGGFAPVVVENGVEG